MNCMKHNEGINKLKFLNNLQFGSINRNQLPVLRAAVIKNAAFGDLLSQLIF